MKAVAVIPGQPNSVHLVDLPKPALHTHGVLVRVIRAGVDGTDREINQAEYGEAPPGSDVLVIGHESFGRVEAVGDHVSSVHPGDYVVATVRRPDDCINCSYGEYDMCIKGEYRERGIKGEHGYLAEYYLETPEYLVRVPPALEPVGVLLEPLSIVEKGVHQAYKIQERMVWRPQRALVLGAGTIGLLATFALRLRGLEVYTLAKDPKPNLPAKIAEAAGATYLSAETDPVPGLDEKLGRFDIIFEATGSSPLAFQAMEVLGNNGVLILSSVTGGDRTAEIPTDLINLEMVLGNKVVVGMVNANRTYFAHGVQDMVAMEERWPGLLSRLFTHRLHGLEAYREMMELLENAKGAIKIVVEVKEIMKPKLG
ncbi:MAG: glucose 1-dehydrogenase [Anaerolineae bacterium]